MRIGTMSILFREQLNTDVHIGYVEALERIAKSGFHVADLNLCQISAHKSALHTDQWQHETEKIALAAQRLEVALPQCHLPFKSEKVKWREPDEYAYYIRMFYRAIDVAAMLGIPWGVVHPELNHNRPEWDVEDHIAANHREFDALIEYAAKKGLSVAFENMRETREKPKCFCARAEELAALIDSFQDDRVGACWDTGHANSTYRGDQWDALHGIGKRLRCTHINDNRGAEDLHLLPWTGNIDWKRVIGALRDVEYPGDLILETSANYFTPEELKDETGRHAYHVMRCLETL